MTKEALVYHGRIKVPYTWSVGEYGSRFFHELMEKKTIWATKCPTCQKVFLPPRKTCPECFAPIGEWIEVGPAGNVVTFTIVRYSAHQHPVPAPFAIGIIKLDRADTGIVHLIGGGEIDEICSGMRVEPVFSEEKRGNLLAIEYFKPTE
jgi:uncharacterized OB-fold protein